MATLAQPRLNWSAPQVRPALLIGLVAAVIAAFVQSFLVPVDCDVSWLITVNEKILSGQRAYIDIVEVNPPASIWLYTPAVWLSEQLRLHAEAVVVASFILLALLSTIFTLAIANRLRRRPNPIVLAAALSFAGLILPLGTFAQREHAALLFAAPALAALAVLSERGALPLAWRVGAGIAAGLVIAIKPHFALAIAPAFAFAAWKSRTPRPILPVAAAAAAVVAAYATAIIAFTPAYLKLVPLFAELYAPLHEQWPTLLRGPVVIVPLAIYALAFVLRPPRVGPLAAMFLVGSAGFALAGLVQARGYLNHALPGMALGFAGLALLTTEPGVDAARRRLVVLTGVALACFELYAMGSIQPIPGLAEAVARVAPPRPSVITLGTELRTGHPLVRNVDGRWAGSRAALFIAAGAHARLASEVRQPDPRLQRWYRADIESFADDVRRERPDVVLVDADPGLAWLRNEPQVRAVMAAYRPRARADEVEIWIRVVGN
jgi:hypothetical protein